MGANEIIMGLFLLFAGMGAMFTADVSDEDTLPDGEDLIPDELEPVSL